jgi:hypothetical protein
LTRSDLWLRFISGLKIRRRDRLVVPLQYNVPQQIVWAKLKHKIDHHEPIRVIVLKARREGISTLIESLMMAFISEGEMVNALVTAHQTKAASRIWTMSRLFVTSNPLLNRLANIQPGSHKIELGTSSLEISSAGSPESERSGDITAFHGSEVAFWPNDETLTATMQTLPDDPGTFSMGFLESTANGKVGDGEMFYDEWQRASEGESDWLAIFLAWHDFPEYFLPGLTPQDLDKEEQELVARFKLNPGQIAWRRRKIANDLKGDVDLFHQEYPSYPEEAFIQSGLPFFRSEHLMPLEKHVRNGKRYIIDGNGGFHESPKGYVELWVQPRPGGQYVIGADSSMGLNDDDKGSSHSRSAAEVLDMETLEQVGEYDAISAPHVMAGHLAAIGRKYNNALIAPEVNSSGGGGGREIVVYLKDLEYWNLHRWKHPDRIQRDQGVLYGWETNARTRPRMLARLREVVMERSVTIHSRRLMKQLSDFGEKDSGRMEALSGHDDLLMAFGIALVSRSENYYPAPGSVASPSFEQPDWRSLGIHVIQPESSGDRLRRILAWRDEETSEPQSFLEA